MKYVLSLALLITSTLLLCMEKPTPPFNGSFQTIERTISDKAVSYDATLTDKIHIQAYIYTKGFFKGFIGIILTSPLYKSDRAILQKLYPIYESLNSEPTITTKLHNHLLLTLDTEFVRLHPEQERILPPHT